MCRSIYDSWRKRSRQADRCSGRCPRGPPAGRMLKGLEAGRGTSLNMVGSHPYDQDPGHSDKRSSAHHWASRCGMSAMLRCHRRTSLMLLEPNQLSGKTTNAYFQASFQCSRSATSKHIDADARISKSSSAHAEMRRLTTRMAAVNRGRIAMRLDPPQRTEQIKTQGGRLSRPGLCDG